MKKLVRHVLQTGFFSLCFRIGKGKISVRALPLQLNPSYNSIHKALPQTCGYLCDGGSGNGGTPTIEDGNKPKTYQGENHSNRIMVVVDSTKEAKDALQWALTHSVQEVDTVILLHIAKPKRKDSNSEVNPKAYGLLYSMKSVCQTKRPGAKVELVLLKGKEKGRLIAEEAKLKNASLLVLGHKRRSLTWSFLRRRRGSQSSKAVADYCIHNANCITIAVRRKSRKAGGYLITTKRHKNFWLLA